MQDLAASMPSYPMLTLVVRHGGWAAPLVACLIGLPVLIAAVAIASPMLAGFAIGLFVLAYGLLQTLVELIRLVTDMLLPK